MKYYTACFTPETWDAFNRNGCKVTGFRERRRKTAERIEEGDIFVCYLVRLSRWCGLLRVVSKAYIDRTPLFADPDPFVVRFVVEPLAILEPENALPIGLDAIWNTLSFTKNIEKFSIGWAQTGSIRSSLRNLAEDDGNFLADLLRNQASERKEFPLDSVDRRKMLPRTAVHATDRTVVVEVPVDDSYVADEHSDDHEDEGPRESHKVQATLARIGAEMGFRIWIPRNDRQKILELVPAELKSAFLDILPLNYDDTTLKTVEQIDVIWMKNRAMARAFEVEHTTAIYSGLLRMADLLALQPNMDIRLHIVAPREKREKVLKEIKRPVFSLLEKGPLYESCSYISYESLESIAQIRHLSHMSDSILEEYEEFAEDD